MVLEHHLLADPARRGEAARLYVGPRSGYVHSPAVAGMVELRLNGPALAIVTTVLTLGALELAARLLVPAAIPRVAMYRPADDVVFELVPEWQGRGPLGERIRINAAGLRGPEPAARRADTVRLLAIGDSFTFGLGVAEEEAWPAVLARSLGEGCAEVLNAGVPGYNLSQDARALVRRSRELAPDVVLVGFVENDLYNLDGSDLVATPEGTLVPKAEAIGATHTVNPFIALEGLGLRLQMHSAAFRAASFWAIRRRLAVHGDAELADLARRAEAGMDLPTRLLRGDDDPATAAHWDAAARELAAIATTANGTGARPILVLLPRPEQLYSPRLRGGFARVRVAAERIGIEVVDPTPVLAADEHRASLYLFPADHHPNARGHAMIAATIARSLNVRECPRNAGGSMPGDLPAARQSE